MTERHRVPVAGDEHVVAVHHRAPSDRWLVCCHGFASDKSGSYAERCRRAVSEGYQAVRFDARGCGESDGAFVDATLGTRLADLRAVLDHFDPARVALFGSSFGARVAIEAAPAEPRVAAVAGRAPVTYARCFDPLRESVAANGRVEYAPGCPVDDRFFADLDRHPFEDVAADLDVPVAVFHGRDDESVPLRDSLDATGALSCDVTLVSFADEGHLFSTAAEHRMRDRLFEWLTGIVER